MTDSYYDVLGVTPDASEAEIERAFRKTVKTVHPDHNDDEDAGERFRRVREARDTLLDAKARQRYDRRRKRDGKRSQAGDNDSGETDTSSHERAREQRRQQRKQQQRQQAQQRRERHQRRTRASRQRQRRTQSTSSKESRGRTRASRQTETRTRKREKTSNQKRQANGRHRTRPSSEGLRDISHRLKRGMHFHSSETTREWLTTVATLPTTVRLSGAVALVFITTVTARAIDLSPATSPTFGIVLGSLVVSYATYAVLTPLPFETPRERSRFKPASETPIWLAVAMNTIGLGLFGFAAIHGTAFAGILFTISSGVYAGALLLGFGILFTGMVAAIMDVLFGKQISDALAAKYGFMGASIATPLWMFTRHPGGGTLRDYMQSMVAGSPSTTPWIPPVVIGPLYLGSFANFVLAVVCIGCFFGSLIAMCWYLTVVPWRDHYERGYQIRPTIWNLVVAAPFVVLTWMALANVPAVTVWRITLRQLTLWFGVFVLPTPLLGAYLIRRRLEPKLRAYEWR